MDRIRVILLISHLLWVAGGLALYCDPSWTSLMAVIVALCMRWMVPLSKEKKRGECSFYSLFAYIWTFYLMSWLNTKGMSEVVQRAIADRLSLAPILLLSSLLVLLVVRDWSFLSQLSDDEIEYYYAKATKA